MCNGPTRERDFLASPFSGAPTEKNFTSLTTINIQFLRPHERRSAEYAYQGARRAPWTRPARQNIGKGHSCKGLRARRTLLAADTTPGGYRLTTDIAAARDPALQNMLGAPQRAALTKGPPRAPPRRSTHPDPTQTRSLEGGTHGHVGAEAAQRAPACPQSARPSSIRPSDPSRTSARPPIIADRDGAHVVATSAGIACATRRSDERPSWAMHRLGGVLGCA